MKFINSAVPALIAQEWRIAMSTAAFEHRKIEECALKDALHKSSQRALQRLIQALLREEVLSPNFLPGSASGIEVLRLGNDSSLLFKGLASHRMSSWSIDGGLFVQHGNQLPRSIVLPSELLGLLVPLFDEKVAPEVLQRLSQELDNSLTNDAISLAFHDALSRTLRDTHGRSPDTNMLSKLKASTEINASILLEQWGTTGHPWHPNYKTKLGLSTRQVIEFSPEFEARFDVKLCALHKKFAHVERLTGTPPYREHLCEWVPQLQQFDDALQRLGLDPGDYLPIPVHPWQATETLPSLFAAEIRDRLIVLTDIKAFTAWPTMSFRTVLPEGSTTAPMVKLPVGLRLTSVQRTVSPRSACMGPRISALLQSILECEPELGEVLSIVPEELGVHYKSPYPNDDRARHLSVLFRTNPLAKLKEGELAIPVGSLFTFDHNDEPLLSHWISLAEGDASPEAACAFLDRYLSASLPSLLGMYLVYGIAFEAHQQNSFMIMGNDLQPSRILIRDFGDIRIDKRTLHRRGLSLKLQDPAMTVYDDSGFVRDKLLHTVFMCHLGELILLISRHWKLAEDMLWKQLHDHVSQCFENVRAKTEPQRWETERRALLEEDWPAKSFLRMRLLDCPTDIVRRLKNPLDTAAHGQ